MAVEIQKRTMGEADLGRFGVWHSSLVHTNRVWKVSLLEKIFNAPTLTRTGARTTVSAGPKASLLTEQETGLGGMMKKMATRQSRLNPAIV